MCNGGNYVDDDNEFEMKFVNRDYDSYINPLNNVNNVDNVNNVNNVDNDYLTNANLESNDMNDWDIICDNDSKIKKT